MLENIRVLLDMMLGQNMNFFTRLKCGRLSEMSFFKNDFFLHGIKCNLTKLTTLKSSTDRQISLKAVVVSSVWPGHMLMCFLSHMAALVGDLAGPYFFLCLSL